MTNAIKIGIFCAVVIVGLLAWFHFKPTPVPVAPPAAGTVTPTVTPTVVHGDPVLPKPDSHISGVLHITIPPGTTKPPAEQKPRDIYVYIPDNPAKPPEVRSQEPLQATFSPVVDPWVVFEPRLLLGGSGSIDGYVSPWAGLSVASFWSKVNAGAGIDRSAIGLFLAYEFFREFALGAMWYALPLRDDASRAGILIAYRF